MIRALEGVEVPFASAHAPEFVQLALKFATPSVIPKVLDNFRTLFKVGLTTRVVNNGFSARDSAPSIVPLPGWIIDCESACQWIVDHHTPRVSEGLCTIAANNELVVVNANHAIADGGCMKHAIETCLSEKIEEPELFPRSMR
jgi:hypothetical protein